jgi:hypothetical protein
MVRIRIGSEIFFYEQKAPYVPAGKSFRGVLEWDDSADRVRCHECGEWFKDVGGHARQSHGITAREFKRKYGLRAHSALVNESLRVARIKLGTALYARDPEQLRERAARARAAVSYHPGGDFTQYKNARSLCAAQILDRIRKLAASLGGRTPTGAEFVAAGIQLSSAKRTLNVADTRSLLSLAGLLPNPHAGGAFKYTVEILAEMLRDFYAVNQRLPSESDHGRGLLPSRTIFARHFGGMRAAFTAAGLGLVERGRSQLQCQHVAGPRIAGKFVAAKDVA